MIRNIVRYELPIVLFWPTISHKRKSVTNIKAVMVEIINVYAAVVSPALIVAVVSVVL